MIFDQKVRLYTWYFDEKWSLNNNLSLVDGIEKHEKWVIFDQKVRLYTWYFDEKWSLNNNLSLEDGIEKHEK